MTRQADTKQLKQNERGGLRFTERMAESFAATYSVEELNSLIAFYSSPVGQSITSKSPVLAPAVSEHMEAFLPEIDIEFERQLCKRIGCEDKTDIKL